MTAGWAKPKMGESTEESITKLLLGSSHCMMGTSLHRGFASFEAKPYLVSRQSHPLKIPNFTPQKCSSKGGTHSKLDFKEVNTIDYKVPIP